MKVLDLETKSYHNVVSIDYDTNTIVMESPEYGRTRNTLDKVKLIHDVSDSNSFYVVEIRKYYPKGSTPYTEHSSLFLSNKLDDTINFIQDDVNDSDGFTSNGRDYHWYWVIIKMKLNDDTGGEIVKVFDKNGKETTERIMLDLD